MKVTHLLLIFAAALCFASAVAQSVSVFFFSGYGVLIVFGQAGWSLLSG